MSDKEKKVLGTKELLVGAAIGAGLGAASAYAEKKLGSKVSDHPHKQKRPLHGQSERLAKKRASAKVPSKSMHSTQATFERAMNVNPSATKRTVKKSRLARKVAKAAGRRMPALGLVLNAKDTIGASKSISKEGGSFSTRLAKFVEHVLGVPRGTAGTGLTETEKKARLQT